MHTNTDLHRNFDYLLGLETLQTNIFMTSVVLLNILNEEWVQIEVSNQCSYPTAGSCSCPELMKLLKEECLRPTCSDASLFDELSPRRTYYSPLPAVL